jgi:hypothetical protein
VLADAYVDTLNQLGERERAVRFAEEAVARHPDVRIAWQLIADRRFEIGDLSGSAAALDNVLRQDLSPHWRASLLRAQSRSLRDLDPERAARLVVDALLIDAKLPEAKEALRQLRPGAGHQIEAYAQSLELDLRGQELVRTLRLESESEGTEAGWRTLLADNLAAAAQRARSGGALPIILSYPEDTEAIAEVLASAAAASGASYVDLGSRFANELERRPRAELFVADGHCSAAGYELMAEVVAAAILEREKPPTG